jgi:ribosomal protein S18 acetylase RimI-like enzyme
VQANINIRLVKRSDLPALKAVIDSNDLFPSDMLDEMISDYFNEQNGNNLWFTYEREKPIAIAYCAPERMTEGTWNLYLIAAHSDYQGQGFGTSMMQYIEEVLVERGGRLLLVETSSLASFDRTRSFYRRCGYQEEARIPEFYQAGEDKIIFRKLLINKK